MFLSSFFPYYLENRPFYFSRKRLGPAVSPRPHPLPFLFGILHMSGWTRLAEALAVVRVVVDTRSLMVSEFASLEPYIGAFRLYGIFGEVFENTDSFFKNTAVLFVWWVALSNFLSDRAKTYYMWAILNHLFLLDWDYKKDLVLKIVNEGLHTITLQDMPSLKVFDEYKKSERYPRTKEPFKSILEKARLWKIKIERSFIPGPYDFSWLRIRRNWGRRRRGFKTKNRCCFLYYRLTRTNVYVTVTDARGRVFIARSAGSFGYRKRWDRLFVRNISKLMDFCLRYIRKHRLADTMIPVVSSYKASLYRMLKHKARIHRLPLRGIRFIPKRIHGKPLRHKRTKRL